jgi:hypothetical protein
MVVSSFILFLKGEAAKIYLGYYCFHYIFAPEHRIFRIILSVPCSSWAFMGGRNENVDGSDAQERRSSENKNRQEWILLPHPSIVNIAVSTCILSSGKSVFKLSISRAYTSG